MKIVNRLAFMKLPEGTVFSSGYAWRFSDIKIKMGNYGSNDYIFDTIGAMEVECNGSSELFDFLDASYNNGTSLNMDFNCSQRDGCFDGKAIYAIFEEEDIRNIISRLSKCLLPNAQGSLDAPTNPPTQQGS
jgi:hypothetical protein